MNTCDSASSGLSQAQLTRLSENYCKIAQGQARELFGSPLTNADEVKGSPLPRGRCDGTPNRDGVKQCHAPGVERWPHLDLRPQDQPFVRRRLKRRSNMLR